MGTSTALERTTNHLSPTPPRLPGTAGAAGCGETGQTATAGSTPLATIFGPLLGKNGHKAGIGTKREYHPDTQRGLFEQYVVTQ